MRLFSTLSCIVVSAIVLTACQTPNQVNSVPLAKVQKDLPNDWISLKPDDWRMPYLDSPTRQSLLAMRKTLTAERATPAYESAGGYSEATYERIRQMNEMCNESYCANAVVIGEDLSPEFAGTALSVNEAYMNSTVVGDVNLRQAQDDWARFWLMNKPSSLSPYPIVNTGGRP